ncbi:DUF4221 family protein [Roseivirga sp.]|uniref:DUF4221 family protein n=1 Tax=Roseivirga sp. TaxID=1964215 RepID=UPI003B8AFF87
MRNSLLLLFLLVLSCQNQPENKIEEPGRLSLAFTKTIELPLDKMSVQRSPQFQYFRYLEENFLAHYNQPDNSIKILSLDQKALTQTIKLNTYGPDALIDMDGSPKNFKIISPDSIFIYSIVQEKIFLINSKAEIRNYWKAPIESLGPEYPVAEFTTLCSLVIRENKILFTSRISWYPNGPSPLLVLPLDKTKKTKRIPKEFKLYGEHNVSLLGDANSFRASNTVTQDGTLLISYPLDHRIMTVDQDLNINYIELKNPKVGILKGFGKKVNAEIYASNEFHEYNFTTSKYHSIISDPYNQLIYRIAKLPYSINEFRNVQNGAKYEGLDFSIMIYDDEFNYIGEKTFEKSAVYDMNSIIVTPNGLLIRKTSEEEDILLFDIFKPRAL